MYRSFLWLDLVLSSRVRKSNKHSSFYKKRRLINCAHMKPHRHFCKNQHLEIKIKKKESRLCNKIKVVRDFLQMPMQICQQVKAYGTRDFLHVRGIPSPSEWNNGAKFCLFCWMSRGTVVADMSIGGQRKKKWNPSDHINGQAMANHVIVACKCFFWIN